MKYEVISNIPGITDLLLIKQLARVYNIVTDNIRTRCK